MCEGQAPSSVAEALAAVRAGLAYLNQVPAAELPAAAQAECLRVLERAEAKHTAARAGVLAAFTARAGLRTMGSSVRGRG